MNLRFLIRLGVEYLNLAVLGAMSAGDLDGEDAIASVLSTAEQVRHLDLFVITIINSCHCETIG